MKYAKNNETHGDDDSSLRISCEDWRWGFSVGDFKREKTRARFLDGSGKGTFFMKKAGARNKFLSGDGDHSPRPVPVPLPCLTVKSC